VALSALPPGGSVISSTEALSPTSLPQRLAVVGAGYIGLEIGTAYRKLGVEVAVIEAQGRVLPAYDEELTRPVATGLRRLGIATHVNASVLGPLADGAGVQVAWRRREFELAADRCWWLPGAGRAPKVRARVAAPGHERSRAAHRRQLPDVDAQRLGDRRPAGERMLAHRAMAG
jgi:dihydrolipoamide dehydrogenase